MNAKATAVQDNINEPVEGEIVTGGLTLPDTEAALFVELKKSDKRIAEIEKDWAEVPDVETREGMKLAKSRRAELVSMRTTGDKNRKAITNPLRTLTASINDLWKKYLPRIEAVEEKYDAAIKAVEQRAEREKQEKAEADERRIAVIQSKINAIKATPADALTVEQIDSALVLVNDFDLDEFEEFKDAAEMHINAAREALTVRRTTLIEQAEETARLAEQKATQDRIAAEQKAKQDKIDADLKELEQWKADKAAREAKERQEANDKEAARVDAHKSSIDDINAAADALDSPMAIDAYMNELEAVSIENFEEFASDAQHAIANAKLALTEKRRQLIEQAEQQAKAKAAADKKAAKAEADRLKALAPDAEKLRLYVADLIELPRPDVDSDDAQAVLDGMALHLTAMIDMVDPLDGAAS